jgi:carboxymethylenebutenolidase
MIPFSAQEVKYMTFDGSDVEACLAQPSSESPSPAVLLIHEIWGLESHIRDVAGRYAREGYVVLAPHLYSRARQKEVLTPQNIEKAMALVWGMPPEKRRDPKAVEALVAGSSGIDREVLGMTLGGGQAQTEVFMKDLLAGIEYLKSLPSVDKERIGATGFCMGGGLAFQLATAQALKAAVIFYGQNPKPLDAMQRIEIPMLAFYAGEDTGLNGGLPELMGAIVRYKKGFELKIYQGALHSFFNDTRRSYNKEAAEDAWLRATSFFAKNLRG